MNNPFDNIVNNLISELAISDDKQWLRFTDSFGIPKYFYAYGDCCSGSWFEHIDGVYPLSCTTITEVEAVDGDSFYNKEVEIDGQITYEKASEDDVSAYRFENYIQIYFFKFVTTSGYATIEMRNSSNGYYGGEVKFFNHVEFMQVCNSESHISEPDRWIILKEDF